MHVTSCFYLERAIVSRLIVAVNGITNQHSNIHNIMLGSNTTIICMFRGDPAPAVSWIHNGVVIRNNNVSSTSSSSALSIVDFQCSNAGVYQCQAENVHQISIQAVSLVAVGEMCVSMFT